MGWFDELTGRKPTKRRKKKGKAKKKKSKKNDVEPQGSQTEPARDTLADAVRAKGQAVLLMQTPPAGLRAQLVVMGTQTVTLQLYEPPDIPPGPGQVCCVQYFHDEGVAVFLAPTVAYVVDDEGTFLTVQRPSQTVGLDARRAFRIPIDDEESIRARMESEDGTTAEGHVVDISRLGALLLVETDPDGIDEGSTVTLDFERFMGEEEEPMCATVQARVVRRSDQRWGIAFETPAEDAAHPELANFVSDVERQMLRKQRNTEATYEPVKME